MDRIDEWRLFVSVAELRSFSRAARTHGRSPQAVTRAIAALEARAGARLFHRTTRSVSLTDAGVRLLDRCRRTLSEVDTLEEEAAERDTPAGTLVVTAPVLFGQRHVVPIVNEYLASHPAVDVRLALLDRVVSLAEEGIDVGLRIGPLPDSSLRARLVGHVERVLCAAPAYLARRPRLRGPRDLRGHDAIAFTATTPIPDRWSFVDKRRGRGSVAVRPRLTVNTAEAAIAAATAGLGIVCALSYQVAPLLADGTLVRLLAPSFPGRLPVHLVQLSRAHVSVKVAAFLELATKRLRAALGAP